MQIRTITDKQVFDSFVEKHPYGHYMKTSMWGEFKKKTEHLKYELLGFYEDNELIGTAMALEGKWMLHPYIYVPWGPCIDYENEQVIHDVFKLLKTYADQKNVLFLRVDPNVVRVPHDIKGNVLDGFNHEYVTEDLIKDGYKHKGYGYAYNGSWTNRYTLIIDLSAGKEEVFNRFIPQRKRAIKRHNTWHVYTEIGNKGDIPDLMRLEKQLTENDGFKPHSQDFFEKLLDCFGEHCTIYKTTIDLKGMIEGMSLEVEGKKYKNDPKAKEAAIKNIERAKELQARHGDKAVIACGLFMRLGDKSWDLYTYNDHNEFNFIRPVDNLHYFAMCDMYDHGVIHYDMVGFSGVTTEDDPEYGLYVYKSSFAPEYIERIGEFDYIRNEAEMNRFNEERRVINGLKRRYNSVRYKKK